MRSAASISQEFSRYAYSVSHDLNAPVRALVEFSKILATNDAQHLDAEGKECLYLIIENGKKLQAMMEALLQYSRILNDTKPFTPVDLESVVRRAKSRFQKTIDASNGVVKYSDLPTIIGNAEMLEELFVILISNGLLYHKPAISPLIQITAKRDDAEWHIAINDNGIGIPAPFKARVFELFQRLHTEEEYPGQGMGLAQAKKIVEHHHGSIWIEPAVSGTSVCLTLPVLPSTLTS